MKKIIFTHALTCLCATLLIHEAFSQGITNFAGLKIRTVVTRTPEYSSVMPVNTAEDYRNDINIKVVRKFIKDFKEAKNVTWYKAKDGGYAARFIGDSIRTMVAYNHHGSWTYSLKTYAENKMPADVRAMVKSTFFDYAITEVTEIKLPQEGENIIYKVLIKHADNFKILQICCMEMKIVSDYTAP